jgi:ribosomal protein uL24
LSILLLRWLFLTKLRSRNHGLHLLSSFSYTQRAGKMKRKLASRALAARLTSLRRWRILMSAPLSSDFRSKYTVWSMPVRKDDEVQVVRKDRKLLCRCWQGQGYQVHSRGCRTWIDRFSRGWL